ncbi:MAG: hypothetical protein Q4C46_00385 [Bacillota bacterium]|nr:hypothetical protein [Bacillota bacterium]
MRKKHKIIFSIILSVCLVIAQITPVFAADDIENAQNESSQEEPAPEVKDNVKEEEPESVTSADEETEDVSAGNAEQTKEEQVISNTAVKAKTASPDTESNDEKTEEASSDVIKDGTYKPDSFTFTGGTGKVTITCPEVTIKDGKATAKIVFSKETFKSLIVGEKVTQRAADSPAGTSVFNDIEVKVNEDVIISGYSTKMNSSIDYNIHITLSSNSQKPDGTGDGGSGGTGGSETTEDKPTGTEKLSNGTYKVKTETKNDMFKIAPDADGNKWSILKISADGMQATITLTGTGYDYLYPGTAEQAAKAQKSSYIKYFVSNDKYSYTIPVSALDKELPFASHSIKKNLWYDRTIIFYSSGAIKVKDDTTVVPISPGTSNKNDETNGKKATSKQTSKVSKSWKDESGKGTAAVDNSTKLKDGTYTPAGFSWSGGTGRLAYIRCNKVIVKNGQSFGVIEFGSTKYDQLKANGRIYANSNSGGLATFVIPVKLNANNTIIGRTTAMSQTHWIQYSIFISLPVKADGTVDETKAQAETDKLSEKAPEIMGLEYDSTIEVEESDYFRLFKYNDGIVLLQIDAATDTALYKKVEDKKEAEKKTEAEYDEDGKLIAKSQHEITMELYQNNVINYLLVPEGVEIPAGLEKSYVIVTLPADSTFAASEKAADILKEMKLSEYITGEADKGLENIDYKSIVKNKTNMCILSSDVLPEKISKDMTSKEKEQLEAENKTKEKLLNSIETKFTALDIPVIIDRSGDEDSELAKKEWVKVYGALYGAQEQADSLYEAYKEKVK